MPRSAHASLVVVAFVATLGPAGSASGFSHRGTVVDAATKQPIEHVLVRAATTDKIGESDDWCPEYKEYAGRTGTDAKGQYTLNVDDRAQQYFVTFCRAQYTVFTPEEPNQNTKSGGNVVPVPARLWRVEGTAEQMRSSLELLRDDTRKAVLALWRSARNAFDDAERRLPEAERALVNHWIAEANAGLDTSAGQIELVSMQNRDFEGTENLLTEALTSQRVTLTYLQKASPHHFESQIDDFQDLRRYVRAKAPPPPPPRQLPVSVPTRDCGPPRDDVGAAVDEAAASIADEIDMTVSELLGIKRPASVSSTTPRAPAESHIFRVYASVRSIKKDIYGNITLTLTDGENEIAAIIPRTCADQSFFAQGIQESRSVVEKLNDAQLKHRVVVWGPGFFSRTPFLAEPRPIELRPVVKIKIRQTEEWMRELPKKP